MGVEVPFRVVQTLIFDVGGRRCTDPTVAVAVRRAKELALEHIVVASTTGWTAWRVLRAAEEGGYRGSVVVVGEHTGHHRPREQRLPAEKRRELEAAGARVFVGTHAFSGVPRSFRLRWGGIDMAETVAETLRRISRGTKVCAEISVMAADADLIPTDRDVVAIGGSGGGADTAVVLRPANMDRFFELKVREFLALPRFRVAEVLGPVIDAVRNGMASAAIAADLGVDPSIVNDYVDLYQQVQALLNQGRSIPDAVQQAGVEGEMASTLRHLLK